MDTEQELSDVVQHLIRQYGFNPTISFSLLRERWQRLADDLMNGYPQTLTLDDYCESLSQREVLQMMLELVSEETRIKILRQIEPIDRLVEQHTIPAKRSLVPGSTDWWSMRIPKSPTGELLKDLLASSYL